MIGQNSFVAIEKLTWNEEKTCQKAYVYVSVSLAGGLDSTKMLNKKFQKPIERCSVANVEGHEGDDFTHRRYAARF